jgi:hypothetical protein
MKIHEMLYDAAKYPFSGIKQLLLLGLMLLIISLILGDSNEFNVYLEATLGDIALLLFILLGFLIVILFIVLEAGYTFKVVEKSVKGIGKPPKLNNFISMFKHGLNEIVIAIIYFIVPLTILLAILDDAFNEINFGFPPISDEISFLLVIAAIILGFLADMVFTVAIPYMASKGGAFKHAFNIPQIFKKIKKIGFKKLFVGYIIVVIGVVAIGGPILKEIIGTTNIYGFFIAEELIAPYLLMFYARFTALLYMESLNSKNKDH